MPTLFDSVNVGSIVARNRVFMSPLTRGRATREGVPTDIMATYYAQRAGAGLIISEATGISREGLGWPYAPGLYSKEQVEAWKPVTKAVHDKGGKIVAQLWHMGRATHSSVIGQQPVSASATSYPTQLHTFDGKKDPEVARPLTKEDITRIVKDYGVAAKNAIEAGFDGIQVHGANGYLIDQFLRDSSNKRTDEYGGSPENRVRFLREVMTEVVGAIGAERVGIRLSPNGDTQGVIDSNPKEVFTLAAKVLEDLHVAHVELREISTTSTFGAPTDQPKLHKEIREAYKGILVLNQDFTRAEALSTVADGVADAVSFGRLYITNPDLEEKLEKDLPVRGWENHVKAFYSRGAEGYTDFEPGLSSSEHAEKL